MGGRGDHRNGMYVEKCSIYHTRWFELNRDRDANVTASRSRSRFSREPQDSHTLNPKTTITVDLSAGTDKPSVIETTHGNRHYHRYTLRRAIAGGGGAGSQGGVPTLTVRT